MQITITIAFIFAIPDKRAGRTLFLEAIETNMAVKILQSIKDARTNYLSSSRYGIRV